MNRVFKVFYIFLILFTFSFAYLPSQETQLMQFHFSESQEEWMGDFSDYPKGEEAFYELAWGWENLPTETTLPNDSTMKLSKGLFLSGNNHSDDLFMFVKHCIQGLKPKTWYALTYSLLIESNVSANLFGIGGSPGESVFVKVGASSHEPQKIIHQGIYRLNIDKGNQSQEGDNAHVIGDLANREVDPDKPEYRLKQLESKMPLIVQTDQNGQLWIFVGTDSGFEGPTKFYIASLDLTIVEI